ncbi:MAG: 7-carboxy-7-deazaguanine synthase QueE [Candidatus Omnitrophica bacterium]|nr:7-carboxy-7-deazaguanine synthase QueE [Candidatus Omnitrophota bacterium]
MDKAKITEVFQSIQGEGLYVGVKQVFIRFFDCGMRCAYCDTPQSMDGEEGHFEEYTSDELWRKIAGLWSNCHSVSFTGGEPLIQKEFIKAFLPRLKAAWITSYLETNGTMYRELAELIEHVDIIAMDLKLPSSTKCRPCWEEHERFLIVARQKEVFTKTVITNGTTREDVLRAVELVAGIDPEIPCVLQPNYYEHDEGVMRKCLEYQIDYSNRLKNVRIIPQMHKYLKLQ